MIGISRLYCGRCEPSDELRYNNSRPRKPIVVFNCTRKCNLKCRHCYSASDQSCCDKTLDTAQAKKLIDQLADFGAPVLLFSGGEPLMRPDLFELLDYAKSKSLRTVLSTNGTLINPQIAEKLKICSVAYVGISLDGLRETNDKFRQVPGAFDKSLEGIANCRAEGIKTGLRLTLNRTNIDEIDDIFKLVVDQKITRVCFYHMVPAGRAGDISSQMLSAQQTRDALDKIIDKTTQINQNEYPLEVLTVNNHCDGAYLYLKVQKTDPEKAERILDLLRTNGGNASGMAIAGIRWGGNVSPDQFWANHIVGNVTEKSFSQIWADGANDLLDKLRDRQQYLPKRCRRCRFLDICNGNFRARAEFVSRDMWADDRGCYLTDSEIYDA